mgnify:CR=1 FL=1
MTHRIPSLALIAALVPACAVAQSYSPTEVSAFSRADTDRNGVLNRTEFRTFVRGMADSGQPTARQIRTFGAYGYAFRITDANGDGVLTPTELRSADTAHRSGRGPASN